MLPRDKILSISDSIFATLICYCCFLTVDIICEFYFVIGSMDLSFRSVNSNVVNPLWFVLSSPTFSMVIQHHSCDRVVNFFAVSFHYLFAVIEFS